MKIIIAGALGLSFVTTMLPCPTCYSALQKDAPPFFSNEAYVPYRQQKQQTFNQASIERARALAALHKKTASASAQQRQQVSTKETPSSPTQKTEHNQTKKDEGEDKHEHNSPPAYDHDR